MTDHDPNIHLNTLRLDQPGIRVALGDLESEIMERVWQQAGDGALDGGRTDAITAETIRRIFEVDVTIAYTDQGVPFLLPQTMRPAGPPTA